MTPVKTIIDGNSIGYLSNQIGVKLRAGEQETQAVFYSLRTLRELMQRYNSSGVVIVWDGRSWRHSIYSDYKATREATAAQRDMRASYKTQRPFLLRAIRALGITQATASNLEADDLAALLAERYVSNGNKVRLITRDHDWLQLIRPEVTWVDHQTNERISLAKFEEFTGYATPEQFIQSKALMGDAGDNIKGVGGIGEVKAKQLIEIWGSVEAFIADVNPGDTYLSTVGKKLPKAFADFHASTDRQAAYMFNMRLVNLRDTSSIPEIDKLTTVKGQYDERAFRAVCNELGFHSILGDFTGFTLPFRPQEKELEITS
jgi:5'-3' exonuclease